MTDERIAKIETTTLGYEDHGIFTAELQLDYGRGVTQWTPGYHLREKAAQFIVGVIDACGVRNWEAVKGRTVIAVIQDMRVVGLKPLPTEPGKPFMFDEITVEAGT